MENNVRFRHEFKYLCTSAQIEIIKMRMRPIVRPDPHTGPSGMYTIRSVYFDDYDNRCFYENENGTDPREKFRIRIYNASDKRISLECKRKERGKTLKTACRITKEQCVALMSGKGIQDFSDLPPLLRRFNTMVLEGQMHPVVIVEYDRMPFVYKVGNVRITLDLNVRSSSDMKNFFSKDLRTRPIFPKGTQLLEVKYDELLPGFISDELQLGALQYTAFSKYYLCRKYALGGLK